MKKGFFLSFVTVILFSTSIFIILAINLSYYYVLSVHNYQKVVFYHYASRAVLKAWQKSKGNKTSIESWFIVDNKKMYYVTIFNNTICLMDDREPKGKIIYCYEEN